MNPHKNPIFVFIVLLIAALASPKISAQFLDTIAPEAMQQIQALEAEKESRTPTQRKLSSQLIYAAKLQRGEAVAGIQGLSVDVGADSAGKVIVDIRGEVTPALINAITNNSGEILENLPRYQKVRAKLPLDKLETIADLAEVRSVRTPPRVDTNRANVELSEQPVAESPKTFPSRAERVAEIKRKLAAAGVGSVPAPNIMPNGYSQQGSHGAEGDITHRVYSARGTFNVDGTGIRIGVLSDGANSIADSQASGDLPPTCSLPVGAPRSEHCVSVVDNTGDPGDEGTAMMEIIHDLAPGAQLYFATAFTSPESFAQNIRNLRTVYGCDIIVDDVSYSNETPFQDGQGPLVVSPSNLGIIAQAVNDVVADGALYFSSAANSGNKNDGTSGTWEGDFLNGGASAAPITTTGNLHNFGTVGSPQNFDQLTGAAPYIDLFWSDPIGSSSNDYDLFVLNSAGTTVLTASTEIQAGVGDPWEEAFRPAGYAAGSRIVIVQKTGSADRFMHLDTNRGLLSINTSGSTHGHNAASGAYGTAATPAFSAFNFPGFLLKGPFPNIFSSANKVETFSSDGPRRMFFAGDGTPFTPGNFSSTGGMVFQQPLITAADGQDVTGAGGFSSPFYGTSAAAPTGAAIAALVKASSNALTPAQIKTALTSTAIDIEAPGVDRDSGVGIIMAYNALQASGAAGKAFIEFNGVTSSEVCGNGDGLLEPGEIGALAINLKNTGLLNADGVFTTLTTSTPNVTITQGTSSFANLAASGGSGANVTQYRFQLDPAVPVDQIVTFTLTINYANGWTPSQAITFTVQTGRQPVTTVFDTVAPPTSTSFPTTAVGTMTGRLNNLTGAEQPSSCAVARANPGNFGSSARRWESYTIPNISGATKCVTITLTPTTDMTDFVFNGAAYLGSFNPANPSQNYLGDFGFDQALRALGGYPLVMSVEVPAGQTLVFVVQGINPAPSADGSPYVLQISGLPLLAAPVAGCAPAVAPTALINDTSVTEGNSGTTNATFTVSLSAPSTDTVTVSYATADGSAHAPADYTSTSGTVTFAPGQTSKPITVPVNGDTFYENNESFVVNLTNFSGANIGDPQGRAFIINDDTAPSLSINDATVAEGNSGSTTATFTVTLSAPSGRTTTVDYGTANGTATTPDDYTAASGTLTFAAGETTKTINVSVNGDTNVEGDETFTLDLMNANNATISDGQGQGTITNDDVAPTPTATATATPTATATATATPASSPAAQALNLSTRMRTDTGNNVAIGGFTITGTASKHVIIRALGPSLTKFGFTSAEVLADPTLEVHGPGAFGTITNNNWRDSQEAQIKADGLAPTNDNESAIDATLPPGAYTAIVSGNGTAAGLCTFEVYDLDTVAASKLANLSTRAFVGTGNNVVIAGFVLGNNGGNDNVVIRGLGPSLASFGVSNTLADPTLELRDENGTLIIANNDWQDNATQAGLITAAGLAPSDTKEAAIAANLPPGLYTAILAGANNGTGVGTVEVYDRGP